MHGVHHIHHLAGPTGGGDRGEGSAEGGGRECEKRRERQRGWRGIGSLRKRCGEKKAREKSRENTCTCMHSVDIKSMSVCVYTVCIICVCTVHVYGVLL